jgi:hypothetical protein
MTTVAFTPRNREQARRFFDLFYDQCTKLGLAKKIYDDDDDDDFGSLMSRKIGEFIVKYNVYLPLHRESCGEEGLVTKDDSCGCDPGYHFDASILLYHPRNDISLHSVRFILGSGSEDTKDNMLPKVLEWVDNLPSMFQMCRCAKMIARRDGWCVECYIYRYTRTEEEGGDCCVCMENEGKWVKLSCKHIIHKHCYDGIHCCQPKSTLCPLCRQQVTDTTSNPYD